jgi:hypothetical protein
LAKLTFAWSKTQHEHAKVVRVGDSRAINHVARLVAIIEGLVHEVNILCE